MRQPKKNKYGQPFSKKQKRASRMMMASRHGGWKRQGSGRIDTKLISMNVDNMMMGILGMLTAKGSSRGS